MAGGSLPYLARYWSAKVSLRAGLHLKHCDFARSWSAHQSPAFWKSAATFGLHSEHTSSGIPCSSHHQPECFGFAPSASGDPWPSPSCADDFVTVVDGAGDWPQPIAKETKATKKVAERSETFIIHFSRGESSRNADGASAATTSCSVGRLGSLRSNVAANTIYKTRKTNNVMMNAPITPPITTVAKGR